MPFWSSQIPINAVVQTAECELVYSVDAKLKVRDLFNLVCNSLGLREHFYFGLCRPPKHFTASSENIKEASSSDSLKDIGKHHSHSNSNSSNHNNQLLQNTQFSDLSDIRWLNPSKRLCDYSFISQEIAKQKRTTQQKLSKSSSVQNLFFPFDSSKKQTNPEHQNPQELYTKNHTVLNHPASHHASTLSISSSSSKKQKTNKPVPTIRLDFRVRFYPENIESEIVQGVTQRLFFLQIRDQILKGNLICSPEDAVTMAAYSCQAEHGDWEVICRQFMNYDGSYDILKIYTFLTSNGQIRLVSERIEKNIHQATVLEHNLNNLSNLNVGYEKPVINHDQIRAEITKKVVNHILERYTSFNGILPDEAITSYLKIAQNLDSYGYSYWAVSSEFDASDPNSNPSDLFNNNHTSLKSNTLKPKNSHTNLTSLPEPLSRSLTALNHLKGTNHKNYSCQYWFGVSQKGISIYEMGDHERARPLQQWPWPKLHQTEINGRKILLRIIKTVNNGTTQIVGMKDEHVEKNNSGGQGGLGASHTLRGTTLGRHHGGTQQTAPDAVEKVEGGKNDGSVLGKKLIETRTFYVQTPQYCQAILETCRGNHELFVSRRRVNSDEQQRLRVCASEEANTRRIERQVLVRERCQRQQLQNAHLELETRYQSAISQMSELKNQLEQVHVYKTKAEMLNRESSLLHEKVGRMAAEMENYKQRCMTLERENRTLTERCKTMDNQWRDAMEHQFSKSAYHNLFRNDRSDGFEKSLVTGREGLFGGLENRTGGGMAGSNNGINVGSGYGLNGIGLNGMNPDISASGINLHINENIGSRALVSSTPNYNSVITNNLGNNNFSNNVMNNLGSNLGSNHGINNPQHQPNLASINRNHTTTNHNEVKTEQAYAKEYEYESGASTIGRIEEFSSSSIDSVNRENCDKSGGGDGVRITQHKLKANDTDDLVKALQFD